MKIMHYEACVFSVKLKLFLDFANTVAYTSGTTYFGVSAVQANIDEDAISKVIEACFLLPLPVLSLTHRPPQNDPFRIACILCLQGQCAQAALSNASCN